MPVALGLGFNLVQLGGSGGPFVQLSSQSIAEDASINDVIGILSVANGSGTYTFTITADPDSKFQIANDDELQLADTVDYETATSHSVTIQADNGVDDPITRTYTIHVTNVEEAPVNLTAPVLSGTEEYGATLSVTTGTWTEDEFNTYTYQWYITTGPSAITGATSSTYVLTGDEVGETVYCTVTATNNVDAVAEDSDTSGVIAAIVPSAFAVGDWSIDGAAEAIDVTISSLPDDGGDTITDVEYQVDGGSWTSSSGTSSFTISGLVALTAYGIRIRAVNGVGNGAQSDLKQATTLESTGNTIEWGSGNSIVWGTGNEIQWGA